MGNAPNTTYEKPRLADRYIRDVPLLNLNSKNNTKTELVALGAMYPLEAHVPGVSMTYSWNQSIDIEGENAEAAWKALVPPNGGFVYLGEDQRKYGISMFHQVKIFI